MWYAEFCAEFRAAPIIHMISGRCPTRKQAAGLMHYEGGQYRALIRDLILSLVLLGFVSIHMDRLRW